MDDGGWTLPCKKTGWIGVDFDGTLADIDTTRKSGGWEYEAIPIWPMVHRVRRWLEQGYNVRIFTARVSFGSRAVRPVQAFCREYFGQELPVTNVKDPEMLELWDDKAVRVVVNTGEPCCGS